MAFTKGINKIYESIRKQPEDKRKEIFNSLKKDISTSKALAFKFNLIESVKKYEGKLSESQAEAFIAYLNKKYAKQLNEGFMFAAEEKKLFEKYGTKVTTEEASSIDRIVSGNMLNESAIKKVVVDTDKKSVKEYVLSERTLFKESYKDIRRNNNIPALNRQISLIEATYKFFANEDDRKFFEACIPIVKEKTITNFNEAVDKTYRLKILAKKLFKESQEEMMFEDEYTDELNAINKKVETQANADINGVGGIKLDQQFQHIKDVELEVPRRADGALVVEFKVPIYPSSYKLADRTVELMKVRKKLLNTKAALLNTFIYQKGINIFNLHGTKFDVSLTENIIDSDFKKMNYTLPAKFEIILFAKEVKSPEEYQQVVTQFLTDFDNYLPKVIPDQLDRDLQQQLFANETEGRSTSYSKRDGQDKYYTDKRGGMLDDTNMSNMVLSGDAEDSEVNAKLDKQFYGDSGEPDVDANEFDVTDDDFDKQINKRMKSGQRG